MAHKYEQLWDTATASMTATVADLTARFGGGTPFFDALDERMRDSLYFDALVTKGFDEYPWANRIVVSGKFGQVFAPWLLHSEWSVKYPPALLVPGNLRHEAMPPFNVNFGTRTRKGYGGDVEAKVSESRFLFLDDSAYRFRTHNEIKYRIEEAGGDVVGHVVLYDGSREPQRIPSFYRWHPTEGYGGQL